jgi:hypothetical protein
VKRRKSSKPADRRGRKFHRSTGVPKNRELPKEEFRRLKRREAQRRYRTSQRGRHADRRYKQSPKGRATQRRYNLSPFGRERQFRYRQSPKGRDARWRYDQTPARQQYKRAWARAYRKSPLYKQRQLARHEKRLEALGRELAAGGLNYRPLVERYHRLSDFLIRRAREDFEMTRR